MKLVVIDGQGGGMGSVSLRKTEVRLAIQKLAEAFPRLRHAPRQKPASHPNGLVQIPVRHGGKPQHAIRQKSEAANRILPLSPKSIPQVGKHRKRVLCQGKIAGQMSRKGDHAQGRGALQKSRPVILLGLGKSVRVGVFPKKEKQFPVVDAEEVAYLRQTAGVRRLPCGIPPRSPDRGAKQSGREGGPRLHPWPTGCQGTNLFP